VDLDDLDFKRLHAFCLVAKYGSLRLAAQRLKQTIPSVSARLRRLEEDLGVPLFERLPNRLVLTQAGTRFLPEAESILEHVQKAVARVTSASEPAGRISISTGFDHAWYFAPKISSFLKAYPGAQLRLRVSRAADALQALLRGELDVSLGIFPAVPKTLQQEVIVDTTMSLVCPPRHPLLSSPRPTPADMAQQTLIVFPGHSDTRKVVDKALGQSAVEPMSIIEVASCETACTFVQTGLGVAIVHSLCIGHAHPRSVRWIDLGQQFGTIPFSVVFRRGATDSPLIRGLLDELMTTRTTLPGTKKPPMPRTRPE
jgi:DNA-binding transcriptional LysR family regulator